MKRFFFVACTLLFSTLVLASTPPEPVIKAFKQRFPAAAGVKWEKEKGNEWEANFSLHKTKMSANFSPEGQWLETETAIPLSQLPAKVSAAVRQDNKGFRLTGAARIERAKSGTVYETELKAGKRKKEVFYQADGTSIH